MLHSFNSELEKLHGFETDFIKILYYDLPKNYHGIYQSYSYSRFCTILEGEKHIQVKNKAFSYNPKQSLLLPAYTKVDMTINKPTKALVFELNDDLINTVIAKTNLSSELDQDITNSKEVLINNFDNTIREDINQLVTIGKQNNIEETFLLDLYAQKLIYNLLNLNQAGKAILKQSKSPMQRAVQYMKGHINESIQISAIANEMTMSESNFSHSFKKHTGLSPKKYIQKLKLEHSLELLNKNSVTEVAFELGYETPSHFIRLFKSMYGVTPKQYQLKK